MEALSDEEHASMCGMLERNYEPLLKVIEHTKTELNSTSLLAICKLIRILCSPEPVVQLLRDEGRALLLIVLEVQFLASDDEMQQLASTCPSIFNVISSYINSVFRHTSITVLRVNIHLYVFGDRPYIGQAKTDVHVCF